MSTRFCRAGFCLVPPNAMADIYIANTCTVTHVADRKARHWLRLSRRRNPRAMIVAVGCYVQRAPEELSPIADLVIDNRRKERLLEIVSDWLSSQQLSPHHEHDQLEATAGHNIARVRSLIKIQEGCRTPCSYCIVPRVRARESSCPASQVIEAIQEKVAAGFREVVLTGTKVGCYQEAGGGLEQLVERILRETDIERLRISSLQPQEISPQLLDLWQDDRLCHHFHMALQSGSEAVLQRMRRRYTLCQYQQAMDSIRQAIPDVAITTDIMVAFPGETDGEFEQSYQFCRQADFANIHVFPFSSRPGTVAAGMPDQVDDRIKASRTHRMLELSLCSRRDFEHRFVGQSMPVLWEKEMFSGSGLYSGLTGNYIRVFARSRTSLANCIVSAKLTGFWHQGMWGELTGENSG